MLKVRVIHRTEVQVQLRLPEEQQEVQVLHLSVLQATQDIAVGTLPGKIPEAIQEAVTIQDLLHRIHVHLRLNTQDHQHRKEVQQQEVRRVIQDRETALPEAAQGLLLQDIHSQVLQAAAQDLLLRDIHGRVHQAAVQGLLLQDIHDQAAVVHQATQDRAAAVHPDQAVRLIADLPDQHHRLPAAVHQAAVAADLLHHQAAVQDQVLREEDNIMYNIV